VYNNQHIEIADEGEKKKDLEGLTMKNWNHFYKYAIKRRYDYEYSKLEEEPTIVKLKHSLGQHLGQLKFGIMLIAKTYGVRRIVSEEHIWDFCIFCMVTPFVLLILGMVYEGHYLK
jgi:hypothetical protein